MWNPKLIDCARFYPEGTLTVTEAGGYPRSARVQVDFDDARQQIRVSGMRWDEDWRGPASLLFHRHNDELEDFHEMMIRGELSQGAGEMVFTPTSFLTGSGREDTDAMPHAKDPVHLVKFMLLGRKKAREYLAKSKSTWPRVDFRPILEVAAE